MFQRILSRVRLPAAVGTRLRQSIRRRFASATGGGGGHHPPPALRQQITNFGLSSAALAVGMSAGAAIGGSIPAEQSGTDSKSDPAATAATPPQQPAGGAASASVAPGTVYVWGSNLFGQCGTGAEGVLSQPIPYAVGGLPSDAITAIAAGNDTTFAYRNITNTTTATATAAAAGTASAITAAGASASSADTKSAPPPPPTPTAGWLSAWGRGHNSTLGHNGSNNLSVPRPVADWNQPLAAIDSAEFHTAAVDQSGQLWIWGSRTFLDTVPASATPTRVDPSLFENEPLRTVSLGRSHTLALTRSGRVFAFGAGRDGALGTGARTDQTRPALIPFSEPIKAVSAGNGFSLFLTESGDVLSCGLNDFGQTGAGRVAGKYALTPTPIRELKRVRSIASGNAHSCALSADGGVSCWGYGKDGQIGDGNREVFNFTPVPVRSLSGEGVTKVVCGGGHSGALTADGVLHLWGRGRSGQLGEFADKLGPAAAYRASPYRVHFFDDNRLKVEDVRLGADHTIAIAAKRT